jgi:hypothetical protein
MGLSFLSNAKSTYNSPVSITCLNMIAYKFITSVINTECDSDHNHVLRHSAHEYRSAASSAIRRIPIIITPSIALLQAIISGVSSFPHHRSCPPFGPKMVLDIPSPRVWWYRFLLGAYQDCLQNVYRNRPWHHNQRAGKCERRGILLLHMVLYFRQKLFFQVGAIQMLADCWLGKQYLRPVTSLSYNVRDS